jgi:hypothetical protein
VNRQFPGSTPGSGGYGNPGGSAGGSTGGSSGGKGRSHPGRRKEDGPFSFPSSKIGHDPIGDPLNGGHAFPNDAGPIGPVGAGDGDYSEYDALADLFLSESPLEPVVPITNAPITSHPKTGPKAGIGASPMNAPSIGGPLHQTGGTLATTMLSSGQVGAQIEGLILGHLPVLAAAWVAPYARHVADSTSQQVALVRMQAGQISIDVFVPGSSTAAQADVERIAQSGLDLSSSVRSLQSSTALWLVRVDDASEVDLAQSPHINGLTLLTGGDDAAVVASYRLLKGLAGVLPNSEQLDPTAIAVRVAMVGTERTKADSAEARLRRAANTFLGLALPGFDRIEKVGASRGVCVHRGLCPVGMQGLGDLIASLRGSAAAAPLNKEAGRMPATEPARMELKPGSQALAGFVPGLTMIDAVCPYAAGVELAMGSDGLHLLVSSVKAGTSVSDAVQQLLTAAAWADDHAGLLASAHPMLAGSNRPVLHLFTDEPKSARGVLNTAMRVHLLAATASGREWVCRDLN